ncbi:hypothetical protein PV729_04415 [Streptomyces europaeiscabiei]|uniref:Uncharacterized protein n=1 Tax=Streptomyces europaeiscabiei TaxID=146819 RepID=A0ABU4N5W7_9ACTN|nr:hypothetical protein [Streptomyces europaeiscabiei]MDX3551022.1 hypothetical protein [Streptomyces europaeiscabiei]MDX3698418.1 hypothetical protein [Streptomyces europaeiscabiei]
MIKHVEAVGGIGEARTVPGTKYDTIEIDYVTASGITKTLRLAHGEADMLRTAIIGELDSMEPEHRMRSFLNSRRRRR